LKAGSPQCNVHAFCKFQIWVDIETAQYEIYNGSLADMIVPWN